MKRVKFSIELIAKALVNGVKSDFDTRLTLYEGIPPNCKLVDAFIAVGGETLILDFLEPGEDGDNYFNDIPECALIFQKELKSNG